MNHMGKLKTTKQMERHLKGVANHRRIEILLLVAGKEGITLDNVIRQVKANPKTIGAHVGRLHNSGLIAKDYSGHYIRLSLSPYGKIFVDFLKDFQKYQHRTT